MKTPLLISLLWLVWCLVAQAAVPDIVERGPNHRIFERTVTETLPDGRTVERKSAYTELGTAMHYWKDNQWTESRAQFRLFPGGAVADEGAFNLIIAPDVSQEPVVDLLTPDSTRFQISPRWLAYHDLITGQSAMIAAVKPCAGQLVAPNVIVFPDAFDDVAAALRFTYQPWGAEQEVLLLESGPLRPADWGLNGDPANIVLEMWSEFHAWPEGGMAMPSVESGLEDVKLVFGQAQIGIGKAFSLGNEENSIAVGKTWTQVDQRQFLIEAVRQSDLAPLLANLPQQAQANNPAQRVKGLVKVVAGRAGLLAQGTDRLKAREKPTQTAAIQPATTRLGQAVSIDFSIITTIGSLRLKGGTTYLVTNSVTLSGTTTIEGNVCVKFSNVTNSGSNRLLITGPIDCLTSPYRPAIFTAKDDDTVGEVISGSTGSPGTNRYAGRALDLNAASTTYDLHDLHFRHAATAIWVTSSSVTLNLSRTQIGYANQAIINSYPNGNARNLLVHDSLYGINSSTTGTNRLEQATFHRVGTFLYNSWGQVYLTNSLLICVTNDMTYTGANNATNINDTGIFQTVGAGAHYLVSQSTNRNAGTTNINPTLLADLKQRTTCPPIVIGDGNWFTNSLTLYPQAQRDTDTPDIGYHYEPLDYVFSGLPLTNASITAMPGVAIGTRTYYGYGLGLLGGSQFICEGTPDLLNRIVRYNTVQEQANTNWTENSVIGGSVITAWLATDTAPRIRVRFTDWSVPASTTLHHFWGYSEDAGTNHFRDCQFHSGVFYSERPTLVVTNGLFNRTRIRLEEYFDMNPIFRHCTFAGSDLYLAHAGSGSWTFQNNLFDDTTNSLTEGSYTNNYNAYTTNATRLTPNGANDKLLSVTNITYDTGWLGRFYLPTNLTSHSPLFNFGSTNADLLGFYHFTTVSNQTRELTGVIDFGFHYVAVNSSGQPFDTGDGDGLADYFEDLDGDGVVDSGETDWNNSTDLGLRVVITRPKNGSGNIP